MLLKRVYDQDKIAEFRRGGARPAPIGVRVLRAGKKQHFSPNIIEQGSAQGWLSIAKGRLTIHNEGGGDVVYRVLRSPGYYCCHCGKPVDDAEGARAHLEASHQGEKSPNPQNPSGYERIHYYDCEREEA